MRVKIGYVRDIATGTNVAGAAAGTFWYGNDTATESEVSVKYTVLPGDKIIAVGLAMGGPGTVAYTARVGVYAANPTSPSEPLRKVIEPVLVSTGGVNFNRYIEVATENDLSDYVGDVIQPTIGAYAPVGGRVTWPTSEPRMWYNGTLVFPETLPATGTIRTEYPSFYILVESPPPEGYEDIVVGQEPYYGDGRSIVNTFEGDPPKEGDQLRYALTSRLGANITVNPDLTYSGTYPEGVTIPSSDDIYVSYWNNDTQEWVDYVVTVNFQQESQAPVNTELPTISGSGVVREQLTTTSGEWSGEVNSLAYRWFVDNVDTSITSQTFTPLDSSYGKLVSVAVTATNQFGSSTAVSEDFGPIAGLAPSINSLVVSGSPYVGYTLTINLSSTGVPTPTVTAKWFRSLGGVDEEIIGQTGNTYTLTEDDLGYQIYAQIELVNDVGSMTETSDKTSPVSEYRFSAKDISLRNGWYWAFSQMVSILKNLQQQLDNLKGG